MKKKKRTYGTGSYQRLPSGNYRLRYQGEGKVVEAANDKQAQRGLSDWVDDLDAAESKGPEISMNDLFDLYLADHRKKNRSLARENSEWSYDGGVAALANLGRINWRARLDSNQRPSAPECYSHKP
jgi:hypothetical protein